MSDYPPFGAGLWHFASYVDRYATDGYAPPVYHAGAIARAGEVGDLSVVDLPYPFTDGRHGRAGEGGARRTTGSRPSG